GGRYAALTVVGMVPAALIGVDGRTLLERAQAVQPDRAKALGARLAAAVQARRDKLVLRPPPRIARLADWVEQLVAESTGKNGRGVVPIVDDPASERRPDALECSEFSPDPLDLAAEFVRWQYATRALGCVTTLGFGPRYLHSTGQLHKGGPNTGLFLVLTADDAADAAVPELGITFGRLKTAQARGDIRALLARGRRVAHVHLTGPE